MTMTDARKAGGRDTGPFAAITLARRAPHRTLAGIALALSLACTGIAPAKADSRLGPARTLPAYAQECGSCHLAYPPGLLPASSWQALMTGLARHFGSDASVDGPVAREISDWLSAHAGTGKRAAERPPNDRITRATWFTRKHREVAPATWSRPAIRNSGNCAACHGGAAQGDFDEHAIKIPK
jgi:mono/diheme cytochrome c family protein